MKLISLAEALDEKQCGGKAVHLGQAVRAGLPVPAGFVLSIDDVNAILQKDQNALDRAKQIFTLLGPKVVARSSATGEDSNDLSFAGQFDTRLNICSYEELIEAIRQIHDSAMSDSVTQYRRALSANEVPKMAVVVQKLVEADIAGVLFTKNPLTGDAEYFIEGAYGFGQAVVDALVIPDQFRISKTGKILNKALGVKDRMFKSMSGGGVGEILTSSQKLKEYCLDNQQLEQLRQLAQRCEQEFGNALDIEWAIEGQSLYLLQKRAITRGVSK